MRVLPVPVKIWLNGHEYAKRAATAAGIGFTELDNGFATTDDPAGLQRLCDTLGPGTIAGFCERWWARLPLPLTDADRAGGYWWDIAMRQVEVSRTIVFDQPRHARGFFEALCADNLDIGRPEQMQIVFGRRVRTPPPDGYRTRLLRSRGRGHPQRPLRAFPGEVLPQVRAGVSHRDRRQRHRRSRGGPAPASICRKSSARPVTSTVAWSMLSGSARAVSLRAQPLSGSRDPPSRRVGGPQPCGSATLGSWPWSAPCAPACTSSPGSPTGACAPG